MIDQIIERNHPHTTKPPCLGNLYLNRFASAQITDSHFQTRNMDEEEPESEIEKLLHVSLVGTSRDGKGLELEEHFRNLAIYIAASIDEHIEEVEKVPQELSEWPDFVCRILVEADENATANLVADFEAIQTLAEGLFATKVLKESEYTFFVGQHVQVNLEIDRNWHPAIVRSIENIEKEGDEEGVFKYAVQLKEFGNTVLIDEENLVDDSSLLEEEEEDNGPVCACPICTRRIKLTSHHLVPREVHNQLVRRGNLPENIESLYQQFLQNGGKKASKCSRKAWLKLHTVNICKGCHSHLHRLESNKNLALKFNTLHLVREHPGMLRWASYASKKT